MAPSLRSTDQPKKRRWHAITDLLTGFFNRRRSGEDTEPKKVGIAAEAAALDAVLARLLGQRVAPFEGLLPVLIQATGAESVLAITADGSSLPELIAPLLPPGGVLTAVPLGEEADALPNGEAPFDMAVIEAGAGAGALVLTDLIAAGRPGALLLITGLVRSGHLAEQDADDPGSVAALLAAIGQSKRITGHVIQTVGGAGHDAFGLFRIGGYLV